MGGELYPGIVGGGELVTVRWIDGWGGGVIVRVRVGHS